jgi:hypothetical protein
LPRTPELLLKEYRGSLHIVQGYARLSFGSVVPYCLDEAGSDERNLLAFFQAFEAVGLDSFEVNEQVVTGLWSDEAEAFFIVEPLNGTGLAIRHGVTP